MTLEEAIMTALDYERRIHDLYANAAAASRDAAGRRILELLAADEQKHLDYLQKRLQEWRQKGRINLESLETAVPPEAALAAELEKLETRIASDDRGDDKQLLGKALKVEIDTSDFYRTMVAQLDGDGRRMFARFLEIEKAHVAAVQFQLDYLSGSGYWFDFKEFDME